MGREIVIFGDTCNSDQILGRIKRFHKRLSTKDETFKKTVRNSFSNFLRLFDAILGSKLQIQIQPLYYLILRVSSRHDSLILCG